MRWNELSGAMQMIKEWTASLLSLYSPECWQGWWGGGKNKKVQKFSSAAVKKKSSQAINVWCYQGKNSGNWKYVISNL